LRYRQDHAPALRGRWAIALARGDVATAEGRHGSALLHYRAAAGFVANDEARDAVAAARASVTQRIRLAVLIDAPAGQRDAPALEARVRDVLREIAPSFVLVDPRPAATPDQAYRLAVAVSRFDVATRLTRAVEREHRYEEAVEVPNPELPALRLAVADTADVVGDLAHRAAVAQRRYHQTCRRYEKTGDPRDEAAAHDWSRRAKRLDQALARARGDLAEARRCLAAAPDCVIEVREGAWLYTVQTHRRDAELTAKASLSLDGSKVARPLVIEPTVSESDTTIVEANPAIGLAGDPLTLSDRLTLRGILLDEAADQFARQTLEDLLTAAADRRYAEAEQMRRRGRADLSVEAEADAALLLEPLDPAATKRRLDELSSRQP